MIRALFLPLFLLVLGIGVLFFSCIGHVEDCQ
jgi:hypothetical protein